MTSSESFMAFCRHGNCYQHQREPSNRINTRVLHTPVATGPLRAGACRKGGRCPTRRGGRPGPRSHHSEKCRGRNSSGCGT